MFRFCSCQNFLSEFFIGEAEGAAERVANNSFSKAAGEVRFAFSNSIAQFEIIGEGRAFVEGSRGVDFPSFVRPPIPSNFSAIDSGSPPFTRSVKVLETETDGVDLSVATSALGFLLMGGQLFANGERFVGQT